MMSDQNPHPEDIRHSQIPVGCPTPPFLGLTLIGALLPQNSRENHFDSLTVNTRDAMISLAQVAHSINIYPSKVYIQLFKWR